MIKCDVNVISDDLTGMYLIMKLYKRISRQKGKSFNHEVLLLPQRYHSFSFHVLILVP